MPLCACLPLLLAHCLPLCSWLEVTDTTLASTSDEVLEAKLKSTAYYQVRQSVSQNKSTVETIQEDPRESLIAYSVESLQARFRHEPQESLDALEQDYLSEIQRAKEIIELVDVRGSFGDVKRLLSDQREQAEQDDDAMEGNESQFLSR